MTNPLTTLLTEMAAELDYSQQRLMDNRKATHPLADRARVLLDKPEPPADGEVAQLQRRLKRLATHAAMENWREFDMRVPAEPLRDADLVLTRAADLLQRQHPHPVAVSERPWEREGWCDAEGRCWLRRRYEQDGVTWRLTATAPVSDDAMQTYYAEALPANALPTPEATNG